MPKQLAECNILACLSIPVNADGTQGTPTIQVQDARCCDTDATAPYDAAVKVAAYTPTDDIAALATSIYNQTKTQAGIV